MPTTVGAWVGRGGLFSCLTARGTKRGQADDWPQPPSCFCGLCRSYFYSKDVFNDVKDFKPAQTRLTGRSRLISQLDRLAAAASGDALRCGADGAQPRPPAHSTGPAAFRHRSPHLSRRSQAPAAGPPPDSPPHCPHPSTMSGDGLALLAQRLQALQDDGVKLNPATANPGERPGPLCRRRRGDRAPPAVMWPSLPALPSSALVGMQQAGCKQGQRCGAACRRVCRRRAAARRPAP